MSDEKDKSQQNITIASLNKDQCQICQRSCETLEVHNWLGDIPGGSNYDIVEVRFKHTRKGFYRNVNELRIKEGDIVAVEASPGHDIGVVSLTGELVKEQMAKNKVNPEKEEFKKVYRKAKDADVDKWEEAIQLEQLYLVKSREIANKLKLDMKIGDVECQGDKTKAIFYYIADERVDFRELIKLLADELKVRIEMRQIGARQEAGKIGGIGPCGRSLCCTTWLSNFVSVTTNAARMQDVSLNPQKLAGQCGKLKCCLNYEVSSYVDAKKDFPDTSQPLETETGLLYHKKTDILKRTMWFSYTKEGMENMIPMPVERVNEIRAKNKKGEKVFEIKAEEKQVKSGEDYKSAIEEDSLTRFDNKKSSKPKKRKGKTKKRRNNPRNNEK